MTALTIIANITANSDKIEMIKAELIKLIVPTRAEAGCLQYDLHQDNENPAHFTFFERWASRELLQTHIASAHFKNYIKASDGAVVDFTVNELTKIA